MFERYVLPPSSRCRHENLKSHIGLDILNLLHDIFIICDSANVTAEQIMLHHNQMYTHIKYTLELQSNHSNLFGSGTSLSSLPTTQHAGHEEFFRIKQVASNNVYDVTK
jgi:hypothetical protein